MTQSPTGFGSDQKFLPLIAVVLILVVFALTWIGIRESRSDSLRLLQMQGKAFTEALAQSAENAITAESFFDFMVHKRFNEITREIAPIRTENITVDFLSSLAQRHSLYGLFVYNFDSTLIAGTSLHGPVLNPPDFIQQEVYDLIANPEEKYILLFNEGDTPEETVHYYLEITNELDRIILIISDALYYADALSQTRIGILAQKMAGEEGVEYIIYHTSEGIIFSSVKASELPDIESDPFLASALEADTISYRVYNISDENVLELVRPFSSARYPFGLLRVGLSLKGYYSISSGFDRQMLTIAGVLTVLLLVLLLYLNTRRKRRMIARQYSQMKSITDRIFDEMRTGVASVDAKGQIDLVNQAFERIADRGKLSGRMWNEVFSEQEFSKEILFNRARRSEDQEITFTRAGKQKTLLISVSELEPDAQTASGVILVVYDITRLKEFEQKAARRERLSEMGDLAAGVAHEIRNPLNTISIAAQRLASEFKPEANEEEYNSFTSRIKDETRRLNDIITRFLALARDENLKKSRIRLDQLIKEQIDFLALEASRFSITIEWGELTAVEVLADSDALKQVIQNLYSNSRDAFSGSPGRIKISVEQVEGFARITFEDDGPGIPIELHEKIFTPYFTTKDAGTGLGLPTVHKIITAAGGEITVSKSPLGGARFTATIPLKK